MGMKGINQTIRLGLEILTPTQTGSGAKLFKELDYIDRSGEVFVVDQVQSMNVIAAGDVDLKPLLASAKLSDLAQAAGQDFGYKLPWQSSKQNIPEEVREQLKDAMNRPYVPGSALKGAIRTVLIADWLRSAIEMKVDLSRELPKQDPFRKANPKSAAKNLMDLLTGKDAKQDIFRAFKVKDTLFNSPDLSLADIRWLNEKRWRSMSQRQSRDDWRQADGVFAETLSPDALAPLTLQWDEFLLSDTRWHQKGTIASILPKNFEELKAKLNQHAMYRLGREITFYHEQGKPAPENECKRLKALIEKDADAAYLQLS